jgi:hypothetical protein
MQRAQIAIMPTNSASDVSAAASSTTALTIGLSHLVEHKANIVLFLFSSQPAPTTQGKFHQNALWGGSFVGSCRASLVSILALTWK